MKQPRAYPRAHITRKAEQSLRAGHPWVYGTEIVRFEGECRDGELIDLASSAGAYLGTGLLNRRSKITVRILSRNANDRFDADFYRRRLEHALAYRKTVMGGDYACCRLIFGEADFFPGLTVDRFGDILVAQTLSLGMDRLRPLLFPLLCELLEADGQPVRGIYERNDVAIRELEGLPQGTGFFPLEGRPVPAETRTEIMENGIRYEVDFATGQKTGYFLDQKLNRRAVASIAAGRRVLDCFTHTGSFALNAAMGGAESVHAVDISADAVELTRANIRRNGLEGKVTAEAANVFDLLARLASGPKAPYDLIILDPPAFTKSRKTVDNAVRGYKEINLRAMQLLPRGGYLATCSCSHFMTDEKFRAMLRDAAADAFVSLRQIEARQQSPDHPVLWNVPETDYLKFYLFQVV